MALTHPKSGNQFWRAGAPSCWPYLFGLCSREARGTCWGLPSFSWLCSKRNLWTTSLPKSTTKFWGQPRDLEGATELEQMKLPKPPEVHLQLALQKAQLLRQELQVFRPSLEPGSARGGGKGMGRCGKHGQMTRRQMKTHTDKYLSTLGFRLAMINIL